MTDTLNRLVAAAQQSTAAEKALLDSEGKNYGELTARAMQARQALSDALDDYKAEVGRHEA